MKALLKIISEGLILGLISIVSVTATMGGEMPANDQTAIEQLLDKAASQVQQRQFDTAAATLERALRLEPKNAEIWHLLAQVRLHQGQYQQAEAMAEKSNHFTGSNYSLQERNNHVIAIAEKLARGEQPNTRQGEDINQDLAKFPVQPFRQYKPDPQTANNLEALVTVKPRTIDPDPAPAPMQTNEHLSEQNILQIAQPSFVVDAKVAHPQNAVHLQLLPQHPEWQQDFADSAEELCDFPQHIGPQFTGPRYTGLQYPGSQYLERDRAYHAHQDANVSRLDRYRDYRGGHQLHNW